MGYILQSRYLSEATLLNELLHSKTVAATAERINEDLQQAASHRLSLLASAVRVYPTRPITRSGVLATLARTVEEVRERMQLTQAVELYVTQDPSINASVSSERSRILIVLTSALVEKFPTEELRFVLGHEIGHTIFCHHHLPAEVLVMGKSVNALERARIRGWQRSSEISADRCGLISCDSMSVAASALFRLMSGLGGSDLLPNPDHLLDEWEHLLDEMGQSTRHPEWPNSSHPVMLLRIKALSAYWRYLTSPAQSPMHPDDEIDRLLTLMDPFESHIPGQQNELMEFFIWGGLFIALANGEIHDAELRHIESVAPAEILMPLLQQGIPSADQCLVQFQSLVFARQSELTFLEVYAIMEGLISMANSDGEIDQAEFNAILALGNLFGAEEYHCREWIQDFFA